MIPNVFFDQKLFLTSILYWDLTENIEGEEKKSFLCPNPCAVRVCNLILQTLAKILEAGLDSKGQGLGNIGQREPEKNPLIGRTKVKHPGDQVQRIVNRIRIRVATWKVLRNTKIDQSNNILKPRRKGWGDYWEQSPYISSSVSHCNSEKPLS